MDYTPEDKQRFFDLAVERGYLTAEHVCEWNFLAVEEFLHNGHMTRDQFLEVAGEAGIDTTQWQQPPPQEREKEDPSNSPHPKMRPRPPLLQKFSGKKSAFKKKSKPHQAVLSSSKDKPPPPRDDGHWKKQMFDETQELLERERQFNDKLKARSKRDLQQFLRSYVFSSGALLVALNVFFLSGFLHLFWCFAVGAAAGYVLEQQRGSWRFAIFSGAFFLQLVGGEILGAGLIAQIFRGGGSVVVFMLICFSCLIYLAFAGVLGRHIESKYSNYY